MGRSNGALRVGGQGEDSTHSSLVTVIYILTVVLQSVLFSLEQELWHVPGSPVWIKSDNYGMFALRRKLSSCIICFNYIKHGARVTNQMCSVSADF